MLLEERFFRLPSILWPSYFLFLELTLQKKLTSASVSSVSKTASTSLPSWENLHPSSTCLPSAADCSFYISSGLSKNKSKTVICSVSVAICKSRFTRDEGSL